MINELGYLMVPHLRADPGWKVIVLIPVENIKANNSIESIHNVTAKNRADFNFHFFFFFFLQDRISTLT